MSAIADAAVRLASGGHPVIALHNIASGGRCSCGKRDCTSPGKHPRLAHGLKEASTDPATVAGWWRRWRSANIGLATGEAAGLVVLDIDGPAGEGALARLEAVHGSLPATRWAATGRGRHGYFRWPGVRVGNSAGRLGPGIDIRGEGGYVVAPPSNHVSGSTYTWANNERVAELPSWLVDLLRPPPPTPPGVKLACDRLAGTSRRARYAEAALAQEEASVRTAIPGTRNHRLNAAAFSLGQLIADGLLDAHEVGGVLLNAAVGAGLTEVEAWATIRSGLNAGQLRPRGRTA